MTSVRGVLGECLADPNRWTLQARTDSSRPGTRLYRFSAADADPQAPVDVSVRETEWSEGGTGCRVWPSALLLGQWMMEQKGAFAGKSVIELGAGVGLPGLLAARLGAERVTLTDCLPGVLAGLQDAIEQQCSGGAVATGLLDWVVESGGHAALYDTRDDKSGSLTTEAFLRKQQETAGLRSGATQISPVPAGEQFGVVLAADVMYEPHHAKVLVAVLTARCSLGGRCFLVCPIRDAGLAVRAFAALAHDAGFRGAVVAPGTSEAPARTVVLLEVATTDDSLFARGAVMLRLVRGDAATSSDGSDDGILLPAATPDTASDTEYETSDDGELPWGGSQSDDSDDPRLAVENDPVVPDGLTKAQRRQVECALRKQRGEEMVRSAQLSALGNFRDALAAEHQADETRVAARCESADWDAARMQADADSLMATFAPATQFGVLHGEKWLTLSLRSHNGQVDSDQPGLDYSSTPAWQASSYIVPNLVRMLQLPSSSSSFTADQEQEAGASADIALDEILQRVRLSIIPADTNVAWHVDYEDTHTNGPIRVHIPIITSPTFALEIGGNTVIMDAAELWVANFEIPHRLSNGNTDATTSRVHLIFDLGPREGSDPGVFWSQLNASAFGRVIAKAHAQLFSHSDHSRYASACSDAFTAYRWAAPSVCTAKDIAKLEATVYLNTKEGESE